MESRPTTHFENFPDFLAKSLRDGTKLRVYHVSTPPTSCPPIFAAPPGQSEEPTTCESHFLAVSQTPASHEGSTIPIDGDNTSPGSTEAGADDNKHVFVLGIEVLVFTTEDLTTVFVSKADSTGFLPRPALSQGKSSIIQTVIAAFLEWIVTRQLTLEASTTEQDYPRRLSRSKSANDGTIELTNSQESGTEAETYENSQTRSRRLVLSLFARSQNQYLFPGSIENSTKHVLDDRQLIKWWCKVLDGLVSKHWKVQPATLLRSTNGSSARHTTSNVFPETANGLEAADDSVQPQAFVIVPGCDFGETKRSFFPPSAQYAGQQNASRWHNSYPSDQLTHHDQSRALSPLAVRCMIPRLPDDPKARFCNDLDTAGVDDKGHWKDIKTLPQFWETMEYRQECGSGRLVGFVWVVFDLNQAGSRRSVATNRANGDTFRHVSSLPTPEPSFRVEDNTRNAAICLLAETTQIQRNPTSVILSSDQYNDLSDYLINDADFAGIDIAVESTKHWIAKAKELSATPSLGVDVEGKATLPDSGTVTTTTARDKADVSGSHGHASAEVEAATPVNVLMGVRKKKRKVDEISGAVDEKGAEAMIATPTRTRSVDAKQVSTGDSATLLSSGLVRKKPKASPT